MRDARYADLLLDRWVIRNLALGRHARVVYDLTRIKGLHLMDCGRALVGRQGRQIQGSTLSHLPANVVNAAWLSIESGARCPGLGAKEVAPWFELHAEVPPVLEVRNFHAVAVEGRLEGGTHDTVLAKYVDGGYVSRRSG